MSVHISKIFKNAVCHSPFAIYCLAGRDLDLKIKSQLNFAAGNLHSALLSREAVHLCMAFRRCNLMLGRNSIVLANMRKTKGFLSREGVNCCPPVIVLSFSGTDSGLGRLGMIPT